MERRYGGGRDAVLIVEQLDGARQNPFDADAVRAHDGRSLPSSHRHVQPHRLRVFVSQLEDMPDFHGFENFDRAPQWGISPASSGGDQYIPA